MKRYRPGGVIKDTLYNLWLSYGKHKWFGKWGDGKDLRWYLYRGWIFIGAKGGYIRKYNKDRDTALEYARIALEEALSPQLKAMLGDKHNDK